MNDQLSKLISVAHARGASDAEISRVTGYSVPYINTLRRSLGLSSKHMHQASSADRISKIIKRIEAGETLEQIGDSIGVTRERVRQLASKGGVTGQTGMATRRLLWREARRRENQTKDEEREARYQRTYGCSYAEVIRLNAGVLLSIPGSRALEYRYWIRNVRGIMRTECSLTFPQWCAVWGEHWEDRGRGCGYRISRIDRHGAFTPDNVICERGNESMSRHRKLNPWTNTKAVLA